MEKNSRNVSIIRKTNNGAKIMNNGPHQEYVESFQRIYNLVRPILGQRNALIWMHTENLGLGGLKPYQLILRGREDKLKVFIKNAATNNNFT